MKVDKLHLHAVWVIRNGYKKQFCKLVKIFKKIRICRSAPLGSIPAWEWADYDSFTYCVCWIIHTCEVVSDHRSLY